MKKLLFLLLFLPFVLYGQNSRTIRNSWEGNGLNPNAKVRTLNFFINIIYDVDAGWDPLPNDANSAWPSAVTEGINNEAIPSYLDSRFSFLDTGYHTDNLHGCMTRVYGEASFDSLQITGDFVVVNLKKSYITPVNDTAFNYMKIARCALRYLNEHGGLQTIFGHNAVSDYDYNGNYQVGFVQFFIRNITGVHGKMDIGSGKATSLDRNDSIRIGNRKYRLGSIATFQCVGNADIGKNPTGIVCHEISHKLFGSNAFHTTGGNHRGSGDYQMPFLTIQGGHGLMGCANSSLVGCNAYERLRMHWKHPSAPDYITARDSTNTAYCISDISKVDGNRTFRLRDFLTTGDAVRIQLPYKDREACPNQYIWLENHKIGTNGKLDFLQHSNGSTCRPMGAAGIYAYYQVGRDTLTENQTEYGEFALYNQPSSVWTENDRDNLRQIPAEGYYNYGLVRMESDQTYNMGCINYDDHDYYHVRKAENPFNGYSDLETQFHPEEADNVLTLANEYVLWRKLVGNETNDSLAFLGDERDAFSTYSHLNMGTNPSTCNARTYYNYLDEHGQSDYASNHDNPRSERTTWLSGLGITMIPQADGDFIVRIRWDDYDIRNDAEWTGRIALREEAVLTRGHRILLTRNLTPEQPFRDENTGCFAQHTFLSCEDASEFTLRPQSRLMLEKQSRVLLKDGSTFILEDSAEVRIGAGCVFEAETEAALRLGRAARITVDSGGVLMLRNLSRFQRKAHIRVHPGGKLIADGATLTHGTDSLWEGIIVEGRPDRDRTEPFQGSVMLNNSIISHAECALSVGERLHGYGKTVEGGIWQEFEWYCNGGGIVRATRSIFSNNMTAVVFADYDRPQSIYSVEMLAKACFRECVFDISEAVDGFRTHVLLFGVKDPVFRGCTFSDSRSAAEDLQRGCGIKAFRSAVDLDCYEDISGNTSYNNSFSGFQTAIYLKQSDPLSSRIRHTSFTDNLTAIHALTTDYLLCSQNLFQVQPPETNAGNTCGILLEYSNAYTVQDNEFIGGTDGSTGICILSSGPCANEVRRNTFRNLCVGIRVSGENADLSTDTASKGLSLYCNLFMNNSSDFLVDADATLASAQGASLHAAGNVFQNSATNIAKNSTQELYYYYNANESNHNPQQNTGNIGSLHRKNTSADDCENSYGALTEEAGIVTLAQLEQVYEELSASYRDAQDIYDRSYLHKLLPGGNNTAPTMQLSAFAAMQHQGLTLASTCRTAMQKIAETGSWDNEACRLWLERSNSLRSAYALMEYAYRFEPERFQTLLNTISSQYTAFDADEFVALSELYELRRPADSIGCGWMKLTDAGIVSLNAAAAADGYAGAVAKAVLDTYYGEAYGYGEQHPAYPVTYTCVLRRNRSDSTGRKDSSDAKIQMLTVAADSADTLPERTSYRSFFGKKSTAWALFVPPWATYTSDLVKNAKVNAYAGEVEMISIRAQDTFSFKGKKYFHSNDPEILPLGIREDTITGKIFRLIFKGTKENLDSGDMIVCDMSLNMGDTFSINGLRYPDPLYGQDYACLDGARVIVDSIFYFDGRKILRLRDKSNPYGAINEKIHAPYFRRENGSPIYFIEGIGPMYGPYGCISWYSWTEKLSLLLCAYKDDTLDFMASNALTCDINDYSGGWYYSGKVDEADSLSPLSAYPNPASDEITVKMESEEMLGGKLILIDAIGNVLMQKKLEETETVLNLRNYASGIYFLRYQSAKNICVLKFVKQ